MTGAAGKVTTRLFVPADAPQALKYNAYITPQGEQWPNMIAQTSFEAPLGDKVVDPCAPLRNSARTPKSNPDFNYVLVRWFEQLLVLGAWCWLLNLGGLKIDRRLTTRRRPTPQHPPKQIQDYPSGIKTGAETQVKVQYNVQPGSEPMYVSVAMLKNADNSVVATATEKAEEGEHLTTLKLAVPADAAIEPVHFMSTLKPIGKAFSERVAEDRVWSLGLYNRRNLRA